MSDLNPYEYNILVDGLGSIRSREEVSRQLLYCPKIPSDVSALPFEVRLHHLFMLRFLHIPRLEELRIAESLDVALRQGYVLRDPTQAATWSMLGQEPLLQPRFPMPAGLVSIVGNSGTGKTEAVTRILRSYQQQLIRHASYPQIAGEHVQVAWISVTIPGSGSAIDLGRTLMEAWQQAMQPLGSPFANRFERELARERQQGYRLLDEWRQVAEGHFLGILHLDEIQNLFKLPTMEQRRKSKAKNLGLSIKDDQILKWMLGATGNWSLPMAISGTPNGIAALQTRVATAQRLVSLGHHVMKPYHGVTDPEFERGLFPTLIRYQYVARPLSASPGLAQLLLDLTAGIPRMLIALWIGAHRIAFDRRDDTLLLEDLDAAARTYLAPAMPAIAAMRSGNPRLIEQFEDLLPEGWDVWESVMARR